MPLYVNNYSKMHNVHIPGSKKLWQNLCLVDLAKWKQSLHSKSLKVDYLVKESFEALFSFSSHKRTSRIAVAVRHPGTFKTVA